MLLFSIQALGLRVAFDFCVGFLVSGFKGLDSCSCRQADGGDQQKFDDPWPKHNHATRPNSDRALSIPDSTAPRTTPGL